MRNKPVLLDAAILIGCIDKAGNNGGVSGRELEFVPNELKISPKISISVCGGKLLHSFSLFVELLFVEIISFGAERSNNDELFVIFVFEDVSVVGRLSTSVVAYLSKT